MKTNPQQRAYKTIVDAIKKAQMGNIQRLPSIKELAKMAQVAPATMHKEVIRMKHRGIVTLTQKQGIRIKKRIVNLSNKETVLLSKHHHSKAQTIARRIRNDIICRRYKPEELLPYAKEMVEKYGTSYRTLNTALDHLVKTSLLEKYKRRYRIRSSFNKHYSGRIVLITRNVPWHDFRITNWLLFQRFQQGIPTLVENRCAQIGFKVENIFYHLNEKHVLAPINRQRGTCFSAKELEDIFGFVICTGGLGSIDVPGLVNQLCIYKKPIAIIDDAGPLTFFISPESKHLVRQFLFSTGQKSGEIMGNYLLNNGHQRVAYISDAHQQLWSQNRLAGLQSAFIKNGEMNAVEYFSADIEQINAIEIHSQAAKLAAILDRLFSSVYTQDQDINRAFEIISNDPNLLTSLSGNMDRISRDAINNRHFISTLKNATARKDLTAWVGANDLIAAKCLYFLHQQNIKVPEELSVVGFDATKGASQIGLTTYDFNIQATVDAAIEHVLHPYDTMSSQGNSVPTEIEGFIIPRTSSSQNVGNRS